MIQITLSFPTYAAAAAALSRLDAPVLDPAPTADLQSVTALQAAGAEPAEPAKRTRKAKAAEKPAEEPRTEEQKAAAGAAMHAAARVEIPAAAATPAADKAPDYATEVAPLITRAANNPGIGPSKTLAILQSYGARKGSEVPPERLGDLKLELEEALAAAEVAA